MADDGGGWAVCLVNGGLLMLLVVNVWVVPRCGIWCSSVFLASAVCTSSIHDTGDSDSGGGG